MIGGHDITFKGKVTGDDLELIFRFLQAIWSNGILDMIDISNQNVIKLHNMSFPCKPLHNSKEFIVYETMDNYTSWLKNGRTKENDPKMIHFLVGPKEMTCVVNKKGSPTCKLVLDLLETLALKVKS